MKKLLQGLIFLGFTFPICSLKTMGQTTSKEITDKFFSLYVTDPIKAVDYAFSTNPWFDEKQDDVLNLKNKLKSLTGHLGTYYGYETLSEKSAGPNVKMVTYLIRYGREPLRFTFLLYKPKDIWQCNNFSYDEEIDKDLEEATKAYRLRENVSF